MRMRRENVTRERERGRESERKKKLMHGIADPLTRLSLTSTAGGINREASVRAGKRREAGGGPSYISRVARGSAREAT